MSSKKPVTTCQDCLATNVKDTYVKGGNGENLYSTLNDLAIHLDEYAITDYNTHYSGKNHKSKSVGNKKQIYSETTISAFKDLCIRMKQNEINNNQK